MYAGTADLSAAAAAAAAATDASRHQAEAEALQPKETQMKQLAVIVFYCLSRSARSQN